MVFAVTRAWTTLVLPVAGAAALIAYGVLSVLIYDRHLLNIKIGKPESLWRELAGQPNNPDMLERTVVALVPVLIVAVENSLNEFANATAVGQLLPLSGNEPTRMRIEFTRFYVRAALALAGTQLEEGDRAGLEELLFRELSELHRPSWT